MLVIYCWRDKRVTGDPVTQLRLILRMQKKEILIHCCWHLKIRLLTNVGSGGSWVFIEEQELYREVSHMLFVLYSNKNLVILYPCSETLIKAEFKGNELMDFAEIGSVKVVSQSLIASMARALLGFFQGDRCWSTLPGLSCLLEPNRNQYKPLFIFSDC